MTSLSSMAAIGFAGGSNVSIRTVVRWLVARR
jgi:hypothetical protein